MVINRGAFFLAALSLLLFTRCGGNEMIPEGSPRERLDFAAEALEKGKREKALEAYRVIAGAYPGTETEEEARLGIARAHLAMKDYTTAIQTYSSFIRRFPRSEFVDDAAFEIGLCYAAQRKKPELDQEMNQKALAEFENFLAQYPDSEHADRAREEIRIAQNHFAEKELENGITYLKLRRYNAARYYFQIILDEYPESDSAVEALFHIAETFWKEDRIPQALEAYDEMRERFPDSPRTKNLERRFASYLKERSDLP